jgi:NADH:ubiquinone oxidoreductase subunit D
LIGKTETQAAEGWLARLAGYERRYLVADGGSGARLIARLPALSKRLRCVSSPRHAELLLVFEPVTGKLAPSILELYRAMPRPRRALLVGEPEPTCFPSADLVRLEELLPGVERVSAHPHQLDELEQRLLTLPLWAAPTPLESPIAAKTLPLPSKQEREIATEPVVLSLGPLQPLAAGPLRLLLVCDGEQVVSVRVAAGYAARDVVGAMAQASGPEIATIASALDPLAPAASRIAYITALEQLQRWEPDPLLREQREAILAFERAQNHLAWLVRFAELMADDRLAVTAQRLYGDLVAASSTLWVTSPVAWIMPQGQASPIQPEPHRSSLDCLAVEIVALRGRLAGNRLLALRTAGIGVLSVDRLLRAGASGPTLRASERQQGDVLGRLLVRLDQAADDLRRTAASAPMLGANENGSATWLAPSGQARVAVAGPRGLIRLSLVSDGKRLQHVVWQRPSTVLLGLLPDFLTGEKLADAEMIVASLDLAMAEADG